MKSGYSQGKNLIRRPALSMYSKSQGSIHDLNLLTVPELTISLGKLFKTFAILFVRKLWRVDVVFISLFSRARLSEIEVPVNIIEFLYYFEKLN